MYVSILILALSLTTLGCARKAPPEYTNLSAETGSSSFESDNSPSKEQIRRILEEKQTCNDEGNFYDIGIAVDSDESDEACTANKLTDYNCSQSTILDESSKIISNGQIAQITELMDSKEFEGFDFDQCYMKKNMLYIHLINTKKGLLTEFFKIPLG